MAGCLLVGTAAAGAMAQDVRPDRAIKYRQGVMTAINWHLGILGAMAKGSRPYDKDMALRSASFHDELVQKTWDGLVAGSG
ncbi:MAG: cytochrome c [Burkholderiales bacterium]